MKQFFLLLLLSPLFIACSDDDNNDSNGYLTNLERVKTGIVGAWKLEVGILYQEFRDDGNICWGSSPNDLTQGCTRYEIVMKNGKYYTRSYDLGGTDAYADFLIVTLSDEELVRIDSEGKENKLSRVK